MIRLQTFFLSKVQKTGCICISQRYNTHNNWRRYNKSIPYQIQEVQYKKELIQGDRPQFIYKNKIIWPQQYNPATHSSLTLGLACSITAIILYMQTVYDQKRKLQGRTYHHQIPI